MRAKIAWFLPITLALFTLGCLKTNFDPSTPDPFDTRLNIFDGGARGTALELQGTVRTLAGEKDQFASKDGYGTNARFNRPCDIVFSKDGKFIFVSDFDNHTIRKINIYDGAVTTIAGLAGQAGSVDGANDINRLSRPVGMTGDGDNIYFVEFDGQTVRRLRLSDLTISTLAGSAGLAGSTDGVGAAARFYNPEGIILNDNFLYIIEFNGHRIRRLNLSTADVTTIAGSTSGAVDATGTAAKFQNPSHGVIVAGKMYVTDLGNHVIRAIDLNTLAVTTFAGQLGSSGEVDGIGTAARLTSPAGIATDGTSLFVGTYTSQVIRKINIATAEVSTVAGVAYSKGLRDGSAKQALFNDISALKTNGRMLVISEYSNSTIRILY